MLTALKTMSCGTLLVLALTALPAHSALVTIGFEDFAPGDYGGCSRLLESGECDYASGALVSSGFVLDPGRVDWYPSAEAWIGHYHIADPADPFWGANNGTRHFVFDYFLDQSRLNVYRLSGDAFGVQQLDLAESAFDMGICRDPPTTWRESLCSVTFIGYFGSGGTISQTVVLDGIGDGAGPLDDFETFTFDASWSHLTLFTIAANHEYLNPGLDNLVLHTVPEPSVLALLCLGLAGLATTRRTR